jgi:flagellin
MPDGVGNLQVADGSLAQVTTLLNRAVTLATESSTGTISNTQRTALDTEFTAIKAEIDSIGANTNYNGTQDGIAHAFQLLQRHSLSIGDRTHHYRIALDQDGPQS